MELTPEMVGHATATGRFAVPWFDAEAALAIRASEPAPSAVTTMPPRSPPRSVPPPPDTTFAWATPSGVATRSPAPMPVSARRRGGHDTLLSASWFQDASDAAEWREVAAERREAAVPGTPAPLVLRVAPPAEAAPVRAPAPPSRFPLWVLAGAVASGVVISAASAVVMLVSAVVLFA